MSVTLPPQELPQEGAEDASEASQAALWHETSRSGWREWLMQACYAKFNLEDASMVRMQKVWKAVLVVAVAMGIGASEGVEPRQSGKAAQHQSNHPQVDERFAGVLLSLIVLGQAALSAQPRQRPFHDPALGLDDEPPVLVRTL